MAEMNENPSALPPLDVRELLDSRWVKFAAGLSIVAPIAWALTGQGSLWPRWVWLSCGYIAAFDMAIRYANRTPGVWQRRFALHVAIAGVVVAGELVQWQTFNEGVSVAWVCLGAAISLALHWEIAKPREEDLQERVGELTRSRRGALDVQATELRRIQRDLHDGAQARLVALAMQLGRAEQRLRDEPLGDPLAIAELVKGAREEATAAVGELRDLARGIAPPVLSHRGLTAAVQTLADRSAVEATLTSSVTDRMPAAVETAGYFIVAEAITNAAKHAGGVPVAITLTVDDSLLEIVVTDTGRGGADPAGGGLTGLRQRAEALDGRLNIDSPLGKGTTIRAELPCE